MFYGRNVGFSGGKDGGGFPSPEDDERLSLDKRFSSDEIGEGFFEIQIMEQNLTPLCDIDPMLDDITVVARCISKWKPHTFGKPSDVWSLDFVLQDAQGNRVHCTCKKDHINKFQLLIDEGSCYRIRNFGVGENGGNYPLLSHRYKLNLYKNSSVTRLASFNNNVRGFKFEPFPNLYLKQFSESESVDVIGTIVSISDLIPFTKYGKEKKRRNLIIEDVEGIQLQCCFFDAWASKFDKLHDQREKVGHVVMILQLAKVSYFGDKPSVTNAMWGSKLYMNDDIPEINSFRQMYEGKDGYDPAKHSISVFSSAKKELTSEDFFKGAVKKMVGSIRDTEKPVPVTKKRRRLLRNGNFIDKHVSGSLPSVHDLEEDANDLHEESDGEQPMRIKRANKHNKYIDDEADEEFTNSDIHSVRSVSDEDDKDSFIDDESLGYYTTPNEDTDDDI
ncbi:replication protein A 70 kDa DNA-binding subunit C [Artemisia annua]|uniref:Replication protein A 70 kDa DNA-binding subunit C n=1 Tax=Artemisia annua TaxID=35608 RepID=A0A2U1PGW6_ARTAN|nr:replication protein A 70 kDa DNA-binding subunit C [Artemisia annua]